MAKPSEPVPSTIRNKVIAQFTAAIQSAPAQRKGRLGQYIGQLQSELNGMTGEQASARIIKAIADLKAIT